MFSDYSYSTFSFFCSERVKIFHTLPLEVAQPIEYPLKVWGLACITASLLPNSSLWSLGTDNLQSFTSVLVVVISINFRFYKPLSYKAFLHSSHQLNSANMFSFTCLCFHSSFYLTCLGRWPSTQTPFSHLLSWTRRVTWGAIPPPQSEIQISGGGSRVSSNFPNSTMPCSTGQHSTNPVSVKHTAHIPLERKLNKPTG